MTLARIRAPSGNFMDNGRPEFFATPAQVALRTAEGASVCCDPDCDLSGGYAHAGPCEPCSCGKEHAIVECPARSA